MERNMKDGVKPTDKRIKEIESDACELPEREECKGCFGDCSICMIG